MLGLTCTTSQWVFHVDISCICRFRIVRVRQEVRRSHSSWYTCSVWGLLEHVPKIRLFQWWSFCLVKSFEDYVQTTILQDFWIVRWRSKGILSYIASQLCNICLKSISNCWLLTRQTGKYTTINHWKSDVIITKLIMYGKRRTNGLPTSIQHQINFIFNICF